MKKALKKRLRMNREVVATLVSELTAAELRQVAGGWVDSNHSALRACLTGNMPP